LLPTNPNPPVTSARPLMSVLVAGCSSPCEV
jgi:hypothetical protein